MKKKLLPIITLGFIILLLFACAKEKGQTAGTVNSEGAPTAGISESVGIVKTPVSFTTTNKPDGVSHIYIRRNTDGTDNGFQTLIDLMNTQGEPFYITQNTPDGIVASDDVIILFYNGQWTERGGTNTDVINAVVEAIAAHPDGFSGEIIIADSGQGDGSLDHSQPNSKNRDQSVLDVVEKQKAAGVRITGYLWDNIMRNKIDEFSEGDNTGGYVVAGFNDFIFGEEGVLFFEE